MPETTIFALQSLHSFMGNSWSAGRQMYRAALWLPGMKLPANTTQVKAACSTFWRQPKVLGLPDAQCTSCWRWPLHQSSHEAGCSSQAHTQKQTLRRSLTIGQCGAGIPQLIKEGVRQRSEGRRSGHRTVLQQLADLHITRGKHCQLQHTGTAQAGQPHVASMASPQTVLLAAKASSLTAVQSGLPGASWQPAGKGTLPCQMSDAGELQHAPL